MITKGKTTGLIETKNSIDVEIQTLEKETNTDPINTKNQKDAYIEILSTNISSEVSKGKCFKNKTQDAGMPYHHSNYKSQTI